MKLDGSFMSCDTIMVINDSFMSCDTITVINDSFTSCDTIMVINDTSLNLTEQKSNVTTPRKNCQRFFNSQPVCDSVGKEKR